jgi:hypothetical protein
LGITHDFFNVLYFRQAARHPTVKKAYFVGASAHPGTGVSWGFSLRQHIMLCHNHIILFLSLTRRPHLAPRSIITMTAYLNPTNTPQVPIAIAGSKLCAETILSDLSIPIPASYTRPPHQATPSSLDVLQRRPLYFTIEKYLAAIMPYLVGAVFAFIAASAYAWTKGYGLFDGPKVVYVNQGVVGGLKAGLGNGSNGTGSVLGGSGGAGVKVLETLNLGEAASPVVIAGLAGLALVSVLYARS